MDDTTRRRLAELKSECGCKAGSIGFVLFVSAYVSFAVWLDPAVRSLGERVVLGIAAGLAGMLVGKVLGVLRARYQYRQLLSAQSVNS